MEFNYKQLTENHELVGKTIAGVSDNIEPSFLIVFTDDTFCAINNDGHCDYNEICIREHKFSFEELPYKEVGLRTLHDLGLISEKERDDAIEKLKVANESNRQMRQRLHEKEKLRELAKKYPNVVKKLIK